MQPEDPRAMTYRVLRASTHLKLAEQLNEVASAGWFPVDYSVWSKTSAGAEHFCLIARVESNEGNASEPNRAAPG